MANETEKFLKAEQAAEELVEVLKKLRDEAVSYQTSTNQLDAVREKLITFIDASQRISQDTKAAVELLKSIGGPEILGLLHQLGGKVGDVGTDVKSTSKSLIDNFLELDSKVVGVSDDAKNTAKMMTETLSGLDANIWKVRDEMKSSIELITNSISTEFKATTERMDRIKKFVFVAIGVSALALVVGVTILVK